MIRAGDLNRRITLQSAVRAPDGDGGQEKAWADMSPPKAWAQMIPLRGGEAVSHNLLTSGQLWKVTIRFRGDIVPVDCRVIHDGVPHNIRAAQDPDGRRQWIVMTCESGART